MPPSIRRSCRRRQLESGEQVCAADLGARLHRDVVGDVGEGAGEAAARVEVADDELGVGAGVGVGDVRLAELAQEHVGKRFLVGGRVFEDAADRLGVLGYAVARGSGKRTHVVLVAVVGALQVLGCLVKRVVGMAAFGGLGDLQGGVLVQASLHLVLDGRGVHLQQAHKLHLHGRQRLLLTQFAVEL